ncbi:cell envelope integrity EipB family protein [Methylocella sp.]|uniref:cell envelope integrity EipB family protein n=1 Tax=Methylocella sp. TaxID=1978226 RepID=UPI003784541C
MQLLRARLSSFGAVACVVGLCAGAVAAEAAKSGPVRMGRLDGRPGADVVLAPHRAVYDLTLAKSVGAKSPTAAHGRIAFDFGGSACDGYVQNFRQMTELQPAEGPTRVSDMQSSTFEDADGRTFDFKMRTRVDNEPADTVDGKATKAAGAGPVRVSLAKPRRGTLELGEDVVFPTEHLKRIIAAAEAGENLVELKVFDGSDTGEKLFETTAYIGRPTTAPPEEKAAQIPELEGLTRWPVSISYFETGKKDEGPSYVLAFDLYQNGVSRALKLDYGDFVLAGALSSLEISSAPPCGH